jgi:hypothetical protein
VGIRALGFRVDSGEGSSWEEEEEDPREEECCAAYNNGRGSGGVGLKARPRRRRGETVNIRRVTWLLPRGSRSFRILPVRRPLASS